MARIVLFGATGYTGRLTAEALVRRGQRPLLAGRSAEKLAALAADLDGQLEAAAADVSRRDSLRDLLDRDDVLISTVGPFMRLGDVAVGAALHRRAHYLDSNGEPPFTRRIFEQEAAAAVRAGVGLLTAFGWECVPGNLVAGLALREAGDAAVRVDTGYFYTGRVGFSAGTRASFAEAMLLPSFAFRDRAIRTVRGAERYRTLSVSGEERPCVALGASEHFALPRVFPQLREVNAYLGWFGALGPRAPSLIHAVAGIGSRALRVPGARPFAAAVLRRVLRGSSGGPSEAERIAYDAEGAERAGCLQPSHRGPQGAPLRVGPVDAFGLEELEAGCREAGPGASGADPMSGQLFRHRLRVRYSECDPQGVVFNARYLDYHDVAMTELHREALGPYEDLADGGIEMVVAEASLRYLGSAGFDDQLELFLWLTRLGNTSVTTNLAVRKCAEVIVEVVVRYVFVDAATGQKTPIPGQVREGLAPFLLIPAEAQPDAAG
jgi:YbgC/YbaW family acyl-CoA thioester hydrolase